MENKSKISPILTLHDIFGSNYILNPRASFSSYGWYPRDPVKLDLLTGLPLTVCGDLPVICSASVITEDIVSMLEQTNLEVAKFTHVYNSESDYSSLLHALRNDNKQLVFNYIHPAAEMDHRGYWIDRKLFAYLNNKANLGELVPSGHIPQRVTIPLNELKKFTRLTTRLPLVIKAATEKTAGGGYDVLICRDKETVDGACEYFSTCDTVVVEAFMEINKNFNIQFAKSVHGPITYLGASEQVTTPSGYYLGNWIVKNSEPPIEAVNLAKEIMQRACDLGFFGIAGFDIAISGCNRVIAFDLNFRLNGSTSLLLLKDSIMKNYKASVLFFRTWKTGLEWDRFLTTCKEFVKGKHLVPLSVYNSQTSPYPTSDILLSGVLIGSSRKDILRKEALLAKLGIY